MKAGWLMLAPLLASCASDPYHWYVNDAYGTWKPVQMKIERESRERMIARCALGPNIEACTIRLRDMPGGPGALIILGPNADHPYGLAHESKHGAGWQHD